MILTSPPVIFSVLILDTVSSGMVLAHTSIVLLSVVMTTSYKYTVVVVRDKMKS